MNPTLHCDSRQQARDLASFVKDTNAGGLIVLAYDLGWNVSCSSNRRTVLLSTRSRGQELVVPTNQSLNQNTWSGWLRKIKRYADRVKLDNFAVEVWINTDSYLDRDHTRMLRELFEGPATPELVKRAIDACADQDATETLGPTGDEVTVVPPPVAAKPSKHATILRPFAGWFGCPHCTYTSQKLQSVRSHMAGKHAQDKIQATKRANRLKAQRAEARRHARAAAAARAAFEAEHGPTPTIDGSPSGGTFEVTGPYGSTGPLPWDSSIEPVMEVVCPPPSMTAVVEASDRTKLELIRNMVLTDVERNMLQDNEQMGAEIVRLRQDKEDLLAQVDALTKRIATFEALRDLVLELD